MKIYNFYSDASHGWLKVEVKELRELGLLEKISAYSYRKGEHAFLEEDCDLAVFIDAIGKDNLKIKEVEGSCRSAIRGYPRFYV